MLLTVTVILWTCVGLVVWTYFGYLLLLKALIRMLNCRNGPSRQCFPSVSLIIAAYNEEKVIGEKIENSLALQYPKERLEIIVFSDGSTDRTDEIVRSYEPQGVKLVRIEGRKGKVYCKNVVAEKARGEILVFSDANSIYEPDAIEHLVRHFSDPGVGCVAGELRYRHQGAVIGEGFYWRYEQWIKRLEGKLGSLTTVNGAIYAVRKNAYEPLPLDVPDDFGTTLLIKAKGYKVVHEPKAVAWEETAPDVRAEMRRRVRMVTRASYCLFRKPQFRALLNPFRYGLFSFQLWSHKVLRWFTGLFLLLTFVFNIPLLKEGPFYRVCFGAQAAFYALAIVGIVQECWRGKRVPKAIHIVSYFVLSCYAMLRGLLNGLRGRTFVTWTPER